MRRRQVSGIFEIREAFTLEPVVGGRPSISCPIGTQRQRTTSRRRYKRRASCRSFAAEAPAGRADEAQDGRGSPAAATYSRVSGRGFLHVVLRRKMYRTCCSLETRVGHVVGGAVLVCESRYDSSRGRRLGGAARSSACGRGTKRGRQAGSSGVRPQPAGLRLPDRRRRRRRRPLPLGLPEDGPVRLRARAPALRLSVGSFLYIHIRPPPLPAKLKCFPILCAFYRHRASPWLLNHPFFSANGGSSLLARPGGAGR